MFLNYQSFKIKRTLRGIQAIPHHINNFFYPECSQQQPGIEHLRIFTDKVLNKKKTLAFILLTILVTTIYKLAKSINFYQKPETFENILIELHGSLFELIGIGVLAFLYNNRAEKKKIAFELENLLLSQLHSPKKDVEVFKTKRLIEQLIANENNHISLDGQYLKGVRLLNTDLPFSSFAKTDFSRAVFGDCYFYGCRFEETNLEGAVFYNCNLEQCSFYNASLKNASFFDCTGISRESISSSKDTDNTTIKTH